MVKKNIGSKMQNIKRHWNIANHDTLIIGNHRKLVLFGVELKALKVRYLLVSSLVQREQEEGKSHKPSA